MNWLRDVALAAIKRGHADSWIVAANLLEVIEADGTIEMPGLREGASCVGSRLRPNTETVLS